ncbi:MAG: hypothetical protein ACK2UH_01995, partial [Candidatus Promineifilaceae bacterium]
TTAQSATVDVTDGSTISLEFGSRIADTSAVAEGGQANEGGQATSESATPEAPEQDSGDGTTPWAYIGLGAILIAVILLVVLIVVLLRQSQSRSSQG